MNDFSMAKISKLIVHLIGNKVKDEELTISSQLTEISEESAEQHLTRFFFSSFKFDLAYRFEHESDINLNEIYHYCSKIFTEESDFLQQSKNIARHLYEVSVHPNIKIGELYIAYIKNCIIEGVTTDIIGIFKSETKDIYLDVINDQKKFDVLFKKGININKLDKGCLICNMGTLLPQKVFIVDTSRNDAHYWRKLFLNVQEVTDEYTRTAAVLKACKQFVKKECGTIEPQEKISLLNNSVRYFETHDSFEMNDFTSQVFQDSSVSTEFKKYLEITAPEKSFEKPFDISGKAISSVKKSIKNLIKLDTNVEIRINTQADKIEKVVEKGFDAEKQMHYYKIYYVNEE